MRSMKDWRKFSAFPVSLQPSDNKNLFYTLSTTYRDLIYNL